jgi:hypothetical protein
VAAVQASSAGAANENELRVSSTEFVVLGEVCAVYVAPVRLGLFLGPLKYL